MKSNWQYQKSKICSNYGSPTSLTCIENVFDCGIAKKLPNIFFMITLTVFFIFTVSLSLMVFAYGESIQREVYSKPVFTKWIDGKFHHVFAICFSKLVNGDIILVSSDVAIKPIKIQNNATISDCKTYDANILALNPASVKLEIIKIEEKNKSLQIWDRKISTLENIIQRLFLERDNLINESLEIDNSNLNDKIKYKLERISNLAEYKKIISKKLQIILSV